jgi:simple sugar transport system ATP-binding protein
MAYVPEDRHERGLVMEFDLTANGVLGSQHAPPFAEGGRIDWGEARGHAEAIIDRYDVRPPTPEASAESLSGGNQQKFIVGREFEREPSLMVATHPTRGVDIGSTEFIHERLLDLRREGVAVLLVSSKLEEVQALSDRLAVMHAGEVVDVVDPGTVTEEELGLLMAGEHPDDADGGGGQGDDGDRERATADGGAGTGAGAGGERTADDDRTARAGDDA